MFLYRAFKALETLAPFLHPDSHSSIILWFLFFLPFSFPFCLLGFFWCWKQKAHFMRLWTTAFLFHVVIFFTSHCSGRSPVAHVTNEHNSQVPLTAARKAVSRMIACGSIFPHSIFAESCRLLYTLPRNDAGLVCGPANHRPTGHALFFHQLLKHKPGRCTQMHKDPRSRIWRSVAHT